MDEDLIGTIPRELNLPPGQDYKGLKAEGVDLVQQLSGDIWTDYNTHDPGVTILEQLCYALTELSYKSTLDIEDLLCAKSDTPLNYQDNAFLPAQDIFPTRPLTMLDYRRLLIDRLYPYVQNAWMVPLEKSAHGINMEGLYSVQLLAKEATGITKADLEKRASQVLNANRNLCEDFDDVTVLTPLRLVIKAEIDLHPDAIGETVLSEVLFRLSTAITPHVRFQSLEELMEDEEMSPDEVFNGPVPQHGFVSIEDLRKSGIHTLRNCPQIANLEQVIRQVKGVEDVRSLDIGLWLAEGEPPHGYQVIKRFHKNDTLYSLIPEAEELRMGQLLLEDNEKAPAGFTSIEEDKEIPLGYCPILDFDSIMAEELVTFFVDDLPYEIDSELTGKNLTVLRAQQLQQYQAELSYDPPLPTSNISADELEEYFSIQHHFPRVYGVGSFGTHPRASRERKIYARQLKTYLLMMEQHMANFLSQLRNFHRLFSLQDDIPRSYFTQIPEIPNKELVLGSAEAQDFFKDEFEKLNQEFDPVDKRRNKALDHLLARFGEEFLSETYNALNRKAVSSDQRKFAQQLLSGKLRFMRDIENLTRNRGSAEDYSRPLFLTGDPAHEEENVSALKKRTTLFFNMNDYGHRSLAGVVKEDDETQVSLGKKKAKSQKKSFSFSKKGRDILPDILVRGLNRDNFTIRRADDSKKNYDVIFRFAEDEENEAVFEEWTVYNGSSEDECEMAILFLIRKLRNLNNHSEGFHLLEHQLLRPVSPIMSSLLLVSKGKVILETDHPISDEEEEEWVKQVKKAGSKAGNYSIEEEPDAPGGKKGRKKYMIVLKDGDTLLAHKTGFTTKKSAEKEKKLVQTFIKETEPNVIQRQLTRDEIVPPGALIQDDFYSLTVSAVLPAWPARFRNNKIRSLFEQIIKNNAPAHVDVRCHWVGLEKMADFERIYNLWRAEKEKEKPDYSRLDALSYCLLILLRFFDDPGDDLAEEELKNLKETFDLAVQPGNYKVNE